MRIAVHRSVLLAAACLLPTLAGCRAGPKPDVYSAPATPIKTELSRFAGSPLSPTTATVVVAPATARPNMVQLTVTWLAVHRLPADALVPLDAQSSLTSAPLAQGPVLTSGVQTRPARFGSGDAVTELLTRLAGDDDGPSAEVGRQVTAIAPGTTARFAATADSPRRAVSISVSRPLPRATTGPSTQRASVSLTISLQGTAIDVAAGNSASATETAYIDRLPLAPDLRHALAVPWPDRSGPWQGLIAVIETSNTPAPGAAADLRAALAAPASQPRDPTTLPAQQQTLRRAVDVLHTTEDTRPALLYLASTTNAAVAADLLLVADDGLLRELRSAVPKDATDPDAIAWLLDRTTLLAIAASAAKTPLPPEWSAALVVYAGEVGRHPDALAELVRSVGSAADLRTRLVSENYIALEDNAPGARVRAFDWLRLQGRAPAEYDPLADARSRRRAITRAIAAPGATP